MRVFRFNARGPVGDLLAEVVSLVELLTHHAHNVVGVTVVLGEDDGLGHVLTARENLREQAVPEGLDNGANLVFGYNVSIQLVGSVGQVLVKLLSWRTFRVCRSAAVDVVPGLHCGSLLGNVCADSVGVEVHVDPVGHRLLRGCTP